MFKKTNKKGFTLIELIIVVAIMAVLVALLAPNVLKYLEKSKVGKDINSLDSVLTAVKAEITDDDLIILCTEADGTFGTADAAGNTDTLDGYFLNTLNTLTAGDANFQTLFNRLFGTNNGPATRVLDDDFRAQASADGNTSVLQSNAALNAQARICIFLDGNGGVAVAAVDTNGDIVTYDDEIFFVSSNIDIDTISTEGTDGERTVSVS